MGLQSQIHEVLDLLSNNEADKLDVEPEELAKMARKAGQSFEEAILRQFTRQNEEFRFRMSNVGKPLCQLQMANSGAKQERKDYNFIMRMLHGDAIECIMDLVLELSKVNITGSKSKVELELEGYTIKGEDDIEIDEKVYDIKSSSPFAFEQKWKKGLPALKADDPFGYVGQLIGYSDGQNKDTGGWIVVCKSTGQVVVVDADFSDEEKNAVKSDIATKVKAINEGWSFQRCFEPVDDFFNKKYTGSKKLPMSCVFCDFKQSCWPKAQLLPQPNSRAKEPKKNWYVMYEGKEL